MTKIKATGYWQLEDLSLFFFLSFFFFFNPMNKPVAAVRHGACLNAGQLVERLGPGTGAAASRGSQRRRGGSAVWHVTAIHGRSVRRWRAYTVTPRCVLCGGV